MDHTTPTILPAENADPARAGRAIGAMFFAVFGGLWLGLWANDRYAGSVAALLAVAAAAVVLFGAARRVYSRHAAALKALADTPQARRRSRLFNVINAVQWAAIFGLSWTLSRSGHPDWILPAIIFIVGLHFVPLARLFAYPPHALSGAALMLLACCYPLVAQDGAQSAIGALGAGAILWVSGIWALLPAAARTRR